MSYTTEEIETLEDPAQGQLPEMSATSIVALFETTPQQRNSFVQGILEAVESGNTPALKVLAQLKSMEAIIATLTDKNPKTNKQADKAKLFSSYVLDAAKPYPGKEFRLYGATFEKKEVGTKYDYSQCNDPELPALELAAFEADEALKARQTFLRNLPEQGIEIPDKETGEIALVMSPSKSSTTSLTVSLK